MQAWLRELEFQGPFDFAKRAWTTSVRQEPLVYRLRVWDDVAGTFRQLARAGGVDVEGVLDIGESQHGRTRLVEFCCAVEGKHRSHRAGLEYSWYDFASTFPIDHLRIEFLHVESKELAEGIELALLEDYRWRFKDRPPLNGSSGKAKKVEQWLASLDRQPRKDGWLDLDGLVPRQ